jgi:hypothetical protein
LDVPAQVLRSIGQSVDLGSIPVLRGMNRAVMGRIHCYFGIHGTQAKKKIQEK